MHVIWAPVTAANPGTLWEPLYQHIMLQTLLRMPKRRSHDGPYLSFAHQAEVCASAAGVLVIAGAADVIGAFQAGVRAGIQAWLLGPACFGVPRRGIHQICRIKPAPAAAHTHLHAMQQNFLDLCYVSQPQTVQSKWPVCNSDVLCFCGLSK